MSDVRVVPNAAEIEYLGRHRGGEVEAQLVNVVQQGAARAKAAAPRSAHGSHGRSSGYLASTVQGSIGQDGLSLYGDVSEDARTPQGFPYGRLMEGRTGFLRAALGYSVRNVGRKGIPKYEHPNVRAAGKRWFVAHSYAGASTAVYSNVVGRKKSLVKFMPSLYSTPSGYVEGIGRFKKSARTGLFEPAGWRPKRKK